MKTVKQMTLSALLAVILAVSAYIAIPLPMTSIFVTTQSLIIMIIGLSVPVSVVFTSIGLYLFLGLIGLPVFSGGTGGLNVLLGPTGGYLFGFLFGASFIALTRKKIGDVLSILIGGIGIVYGCGILGLMLVLSVSFSKAFMIGVVPFVLPDVLKAFIAIWISTRTQKVFKKYHT